MPMSAKGRFLVTAAAAVIAVGIVAALRWDSGREASAVPSGNNTLAPSGSPSLAALRQQRLIPNGSAGSALKAPSADAGPRGPRPIALGRESFPVDLEALKRKLPDNAYWELDAPTDDPRILREREERARRWDGVFGRIQSGTASEEEIESFYENRRRTSEDYRALSLRIIEDGGEELDERDRGLHEMNVRMHTQRLEEIPGRKAAALGRKREQDERRGAWERAGRPAQFP